MEAEQLEQFDTVHLNGREHLTGMIISVFRAGNPKEYEFMVSWDNHTISTHRQESLVSLPEAA